MKSPNGAYEKLFEHVKNRNECYDIKYDDNWRVKKEESDTSKYPSNTDGYYVVEGSYIYQSPMFLIKCFVAIPAKKLSGLDFLEMNVCENLKDAKITLLANAVGLDPSKIETEEGLKELWDSLGDTVVTYNLYYPHYPESYCILTSYIEASDFS